ncbi:hypothetical protein COR50_13120 [Chitinophaga caeni]|uniref:Peptidase S1 domain-containing protein n=1 Tax=Chitinophaga caeni TaxID=2029983 RepID=A0A291QVX9_9BACT|nr:trypsin-like serine protease [Chitinophaga caeni]ATL48032.1 hypothetical protein COR50_13120 [Chitinophaga caeni]
MKNNTKIIRGGTCGAGSLGGFFKMPNREFVYGITNNHVAANLNQCQVGDAIRDVGSGQQVGSLSHWVPLLKYEALQKINYVDMALVKLNAGLACEWIMKDTSLQKPLGFIEPRQKGQVYMMLPGGEIREGVISKSAINHVMEFSLCKSPFLFTRLVEITPTSDGQFSEAGNSGSVIFSSTHYIVGIILGANSDGTKSYAIPFIDGILNYAPLIIA